MNIELLASSFPREERGVTMAVGSITTLTNMSPSAISEAYGGGPSVDARAGRGIHGTVVRLNCRMGFRTDGLTSRCSHAVKVVLPTSTHRMCRGTFCLRTVHNVDRCYGRERCVSAIIANRSRSRVLGTVRSVSQDKGMSKFVILCSQGSSPVVSCLFDRKLLCVLVKGTARCAGRALCVSGSGLLTKRSTARCLCRLNRHGVTCLNSSDSLAFTTSEGANCRVTLAGRKVPFHPRCYTRILGMSKSGASTVSSLLLRSRPPATVIMDSSVLTISLREIYLRGRISVPSSLSVVSFGGSLFTESASPRLASVSVGSGRLNVRTTSRVVGRVRGPGLITAGVVIPRRLVRHSDYYGVGKWGSKRF